MTLASVLVWLAAALAWSPAMAQVPPHPPGTVCMTPYFWCWADPPGPPGGSCLCQTGQGPVAGTLA